MSNQHDRDDEYLTVAEAGALYEAGDAAHDFDHVLRVTRMAESIAQAEGADVQVVRLAALLHDAPIQPQDIPAANRRGAHHLEAAQFAHQLLSGRGLGTDRVANIVHCIEAHRFRDRSIQPATLEAQCVYDADKLDSMGAIGVARCFAFAGAHDSRLWTEPWTRAPEARAKPVGREYTPVHEFVYKLQLLFDALHTQTARGIGAERHRVMLAFFDHLDSEMSDLAR